MKKVLSVHGFKIGDIFEHDGNLFRVNSFRSRNTVCGNLVYAFFDPSPVYVKVSMLDVDTMGYLNFNIRQRVKRDEEAFRNAGILPGTSS